MAEVRHRQLHASLTQPPPPPPHLQGHPHALRLGVCWFAVPPTSILIDKIATTVSIPMIRSRGSVKSQSGHTDTRVTIELVFPDLGSVNDPVNGLRALIAQFRRVPFVPVENTVLNSQGIYALALHNLTYSTLPNYPEAVHAQLIAFAFEAAALLPDIDEPPTPSEQALSDGVRKLRRLDRHFIWPLVRWYIHRKLMASSPADPPPRSLAPDRAAQLDPITPGNLNTLRLYAVREEKARQMQQAIRASYNPEQFQLADELQRLRALQESASVLREALQAASRENPPYFDARQRFAVLEVDGQHVSQWLRWFWYPMAGVASADPPRVRVVAMHTGLDFQQPEWGSFGILWADLMRFLQGLQRRGALLLGPGSGGYDFATLLVQEAGRWVLLEDSEPFKPRTTLEHLLVRQLERKLQGRQGEYQSQAEELQRRLDAIRSGASLSEVDLSPDEEIPLPDLTPTRIQVSYTNQLGRLPLTGRSQPLYQYLGGQDHLIQVELVATSERGLTALNDTFERSQALARSYRLRGTYNFLRIDNPLLNVAGIRYVLMDSLSSSTIEGYPGAHRIQLALVNFDVIQRHRFEPKAIVGQVDSATKQRRYVLTDMTAEELARLGLSGMVAVGEGTGSEKEGARQAEWAVAKDLFRAIDAYPDLELPMWEDIASSLGATGSSSLRPVEHDPFGDLAPLDARARQSLLEYLAQREAESTGDASGPGVFADPDFYVVPSSMAVADQIERHLPRVVGRSDPTLSILVSYLDDSRGERPGEVPPETRTGTLDPHRGVVVGPDRSPQPPFPAPTAPTAPTAFAPALATGEGAAVLRKMAAKANWLMHSGERGTKYPLPALGPLSRQLAEQGFSAEDVKLLAAVAAALTGLRHVDRQGGLARPDLSPPNPNRAGLFGLPVRLEAGDLWDQVGFPRMPQEVARSNTLQELWAFAQRAIAQLAEPNTRLQDLSERGEGRTILIATAIYWTLVYHFAVSRRLGAVPLDPRREGRWADLTARDWQQVRSQLEQQAEAAAWVLSRYPELLALCVPWAWDVKRKHLSAALKALVRPSGGVVSKPLLLGTDFDEKVFDAGRWLPVLRSRGTDVQFFARLLLVASGVAGIDGVLPPSPPAVPPAHLGPTVPLAKVLAALALASFANQGELPATLPKVGGEDLILALRQLYDQLDGHPALGGQEIDPSDLATNLADLYRLPSRADDARPVEEVLRNVTYDLRTYRVHGRWVRAFPTFYAFIIDEGFPLMMWKRAWDNFYGFNALLSIKLHKSRESPVDTCVLEIANNYQTFVSAATAQMRQQLDSESVSFLEMIFAIDPKKVERARSRPLWAFWVSPGARLHLRVGYGSNVAALPVVFNGTITEITTSEVVDVIAQGDGLELVHAVCPVELSTSTFSGRGERPDRLLTRLLQAGFARGLGQEITRRIQIVTPFFFEPPVVHFGSQPLQLNSPYGLSEMVQNLYPANYGGVLGYEEALGLWVPASAPGLEIELQGLSIWDVIALCARAVPGFVASVQPFDFRSTLFFGRPYWPMAFTYEVRFTPPDTQEDPARDPWVRLRPSGSRQPIYLRPVRKALAQYHLALAGYDLARTDLQLSSTFYTGVVASYRVDDALPLRLGELVGLTSTEQQAVAFADAYLSPPFQKILVTRLPIYDRFANAHIDLPLFGGVLNAAGRVAMEALVVPRLWNYVENFSHTNAVVQTIAASTVRDEVAKMYDGQILLVGDPTLKPYDYLYLFDPEKGFAGTLGVREAVHLFTPDSGFTSLVVPDAVVTLSELGSFVVHRLAHVMLGLYALSAVAGAIAGAAAPVSAGVVALSTLFFWGVGAYLSESLRRGLTALRSVAVFPISWYGLPWVAALGQAGRTTIASIPVEPGGSLPAIPGITQEMASQIAREVLRKIPVAGEVIKAGLALANILEPAGAGAGTAPSRER